MNPEPFSTDVRVARFPKGWDTWGDVPGNGWDCSRGWRRTGWRLAADASARFTDEGDNGPGNKRDDAGQPEGK